MRVLLARQLCLLDEHIVWRRESLPASAAAGLPLREVILFRRSDPPSLSFALRLSRRRRACFWFSDSPGGKESVVAMTVSAGTSEIDD